MTKTKKEFAEMPPKQPKEVVHISPRAMEKLRNEQRRTGMFIYRIVENAIEAYFARGK